MKKIVSIAFALIMVFALCATAFAENDGFYGPAQAIAPSADDAIVIVGTNDIHGEYLNFSKIATLAKSADLLVDNGDAVQGGSLATLSEGRYMIEIMNYLGYDFSSIGNHDFIWNLDGLEANVELAAYPFCSCNFKNKSTGELLYDAYKIFEVKGKKIAFVGITTPETFTSATPSLFKDENGNYIYDFCEGNDGQDLFDAVQAAVDDAKAEGADYVIAVGHVGDNYDNPNWKSSGIIANVSGLSAFLDGHSHKVFNTVYKDKDGKDVPCAQTGTKLANANVVTIENGKVSIETVSLDSIEADEETEKVLAEYTAKIAELSQQVIGHTDYTLTTKDKNGNRLVRSGETNLGDFIADAYRIVLGTDISIINGGGIRDDIPAGDITYGQLLAVHPFGNYLSVVEVTGEQIRDVLEYSVTNYPRENGGFVQISGITYTFNEAIPTPIVQNDKSEFVSVDGQRRVSDIKVNGEPLDLEKTYTLCGANYSVVGGGDGFTMLGSNVTVLQKDATGDIDLLIKYIKENLGGKVSSEYATAQGRINIINDPSKIDDPDEIVILETNDIHCEYESLGKVVTLAKDADLLVDNGDAVQGGVIGTLSKGEYMIELMSKIGYDLSSLGNHDFDWGVDTLLKHAAAASFPYISCNFKNLKTGELVFDAYKIFEVKGKKIAFIGISTPETLSVSSTPKYFQDEEGNYIYGFCEGNNCQDLYDAVQAAVDGAKAEGADYIIAIGHLGNGETDNTWRASDVIANVSGLNAFLDGHSHETYNELFKDKDGKAVPCAQTGTKLESIAKIVISKNGTVSISNISLEGVESDADTETLIAEYKAKIDELSKEKVGHTEVLLTINDENGKRLVRSGETNLGNLVADAYKTVLGAEIGIINGGGVRANIAAGDITYGDAITVHPFGNYASLVEMTGAQIADMLEFAASKYPSENGGFLQVSGLTFTINEAIPSSVVRNEKSEFVKVDGQRRVTDIKVNGEELDLERIYTVGGTGYVLHEGGDGYAMLMGVNILKKNVMLDNEILISYIRDYLGGTVGSEYTVAQGRITFINDPSKIEKEETLVREYKVLKGDCLWNIAKKYLGSGARWKEIYNLNKAIISNPNRIYVGQTLVLPEAQ